MPPDPTNDAPDRPAQSRGGTVLSVGPDGSVLMLSEGRAVRRPRRCEEPLGPGDIVRFDAGGAVTELLWRHPNGEWPAAGSDVFRWLQDQRWRQLRERARILASTRRCFDEAGFLEVDTPALVASAGTEVHLDPVAARCEDRDAYLITSPEYHMKRLLAAGAPPIYQICKVWRDHERGARHQPEFTMLEWYRPFADYHALMEDCERWICEIAGSRTLNYQGKSYDLSRPWRRLTFREALRERGGIENPDALSPQAQESVLMERVEPTLGASGPEFLTEYPISMASLARPKPDDPTVAERVELFIAGLELGNGFSELTDAQEQHRRCQEDNRVRSALGKPPYPLDRRFLGALAGGMPPSAGIAVGIERVLMLMLDQPTIENVRAFGIELEE